MAQHELHLLSLIDVEVESSFLVLAHNMGTPVRVHTWGVLIVGNPAGPLLVDTGARDPEIMQRLGMRGWIEEEQRLENQLAVHGVSVEDVAAVLHTHCHIDHAGQDDRFPMTTPVVMNRRELEHSVSGLMGAQYPPEYVKHHVDRLHTPGALRLLDLELSGQDELYDGIVCEAAGGHTEGSMNILVETAAGVACICGDVIYDIQNQVVEPWHQVLAFEPQTTGNHTLTKRSEKAAIKKALNSGTFVLPIHDFPARVEGGRVAARLKDAVPGPEWPVEEFAAEVAEPVAAV
jgi:glyoxylase-like metal-dependent hydrolase (beta-lactamase superfamily II)